MNITYVATLRNAHASTQAALHLAEMHDAADTDYLQHTIIVGGRQPGFLTFWTPGVTSTCPAGTHTRIQVTFTCPAGTHTRIQVTSTCPAGTHTHVFKLHPPVQLVDTHIQVILLKHNCT
jgi:hypothetical protein